MEEPTLTTPRTSAENATIATKGYCYETEANEP
jgi:hypothetical protein